MDQQTFQRAIVLLSGEHSLSILRSLRDANWHLSSEVARSLDIHITTASKFLQRFAELGLVERREHDSRTFEYRLRSPHLRFDVDLMDDTAPLRAVCAEGLGADTAKGVFQAALRDAMGVYPDLAIRCGLTRPLES